MENPEPSRESPPREAPASRSEGGRGRWLRLDRGAAAFAIVLTVMVAMGGYLENQPIEVPEQVFLLILFYLAAYAVRFVIRSRGVRGGGKR